MGRTVRGGTVVVEIAAMEPLMPKPNDLSRSVIALDQESTLLAVIELSLESWLIAARIPGIGRNPLSKQGPDPGALRARLHRWRDEAVRAGRPITRIVVAFEAGRDGFWLARWLIARGIETYVIHPTSVPVKRDHRRVKTDRVDTGCSCERFSDGYAARQIIAAW
jgi:transposase